MRTTMLAGLILAMSCTTASAAPSAVQITSVEMNNNSLYVNGSGNRAPAIFVHGTLMPALSCTQQGVFIVQGDSFSKQTLAILLAARISGTPAGYTHVYGCIRENLRQLEKYGPGGSK